MTARYPITPKGVRGDIAWLLEFRWASRDFRFANIRTIVVNDAGDDLEFLGGLGVSFATGGVMFNTDGAAPSLSIDALNMPVDVAALIEQGHPFSGVVVTLKLWGVGTSYERAETRFKGRMRLGGYGSDSESARFTVESNQRGLGRLVPDPTSAITVENWPNAEVAAIGKIPPIVIGSPGLGLVAIGPGTREATPGTLAILVNTISHYFAVAQGPVVAEQITAVNATQNNLADSKAVTLRTEPSGRTVSTFTQVPPTSPKYDEGDRLGIDWAGTTGTSDGLGGLRNPYRSGALRGAGDVCRWAFDASGAEVDHGRWSALSGVFNAVQIDTLLDMPVDVARWCMKEVVSLLPIFALLDGPSGVYPVLWRPDFKTADAHFDLDVERDGLIRLGDVEYDDDDLWNEVSIEFAPSFVDGDPVRTRTLTGRDVAANDPNVQPTQALQSSNAKHGHRPRPVTLSRVLYDIASAGSTIAWWAASKAFPWRFITYGDPQRAAAWLQPGDAGLLTDDGTKGIHLTSRRAWVHSIAFAGTAPTIRFVLIDSPAHDTRLLA